MFQAVKGRRIGIKLVAFVAVMALVWVWRPLFHSLLYRIAYSPGALLAFGVPIAFGIALYFLPPLEVERGSTSYEEKAVMVGMFFAIMMVVAIVFGGIAGMFEERTIAQNTMEDSTEVEKFPEANANNPRIVPRAVADVQTRGSTSYRQHKLGKSDIARMEDGRLAWTYPIQPDQFRNRVSNNQRGVLLSDMTTMENREMKAYDNDNFVHGQGMFFHRSAMWNMKKSDYDAQYRDDPIEFVHDGESYMAFPKTGHKWHLGPVPHTTPTWEGVALIHQNGTIEHLSPEEARESEVLEGQRIYPLYNAERKAESLGYRNGILNQMPIVGTYRGVVEPANIPDQAGNTQPFVIDLEGERMTYVYAMEPTGDDSRGLDEVWFFDSRTGEERYFSTDNDTLLGPERAMGIVRSEDSRTNWNTEDGNGQFEVVEPIPTVINDELWWHTKIVPVDKTDVTRNSFVNAHTGNVVELHDADSVVEFMSGVNASDIDDADEVRRENATDDANVSYYLVIYDSDGNEIDRIPVQGGESVEIEREEE